MRHREELEAMAAEIAKGLLEKVGPRAKIIIVLSDEDDTKYEMGAYVYAPRGYAAMGFLERSYDVLKPLTGM